MEDGCLQACALCVCGSHWRDCNVNVQMTMLQLAHYDYVSCAHTCFDLDLLPSLTEPLDAVLRRVYPQPIGSNVQIIVQAQVETLSGLQALQNFRSHTYSVAQRACSSSILFGRLWVHECLRARLISVSLPGEGAGRVSVS